MYNQNSQLAAFYVIDKVCIYSNFAAAQDRHYAQRTSLKSSRVFVSPSSAHACVIKLIFLYKPFIGIVGFSAKSQINKKKNEHKKIGSESKTLGEDALLVD